MEVILRCEFDNTSYGSGFKIINPPVLPLTGEVFNADWEHYITDKDQLVQILEDRENCCFIVEIFSRKYSSENVEILVVLHRDDSHEIKRLKRKDVLIFG